MMRIWLDDEREPIGSKWTWIKDAREALAQIKFGNVQAISLDHDLANDPYTGYWLLCEVERSLANGHEFNPLPEFYVHSANPVGRSNMDRAIRAIEGRFWGLRDIARRSQ